jgi:glyoxylase-like metal-dependent hydrolase (beta-lactamase superfamily II)
LKIITIPVGPLQVNCYLAACETTGEAVAIDPGDEPPRIIEAIEREGLALKRVLLTHCHADHVGGLKGLVEGCRAPVLMHEGDRPMLDSAVEHGRLFGLEIEAPPAPDGYLAEGDSVDFGEESLKVLHTPGHSPGGICFLGRAEVFVGDTLFAGSIGRFDFPGGSYEKLIQGISSKILSLPEDTVVYPGHGPATNVGQEKRTNPFFI